MLSTQTARVFIAAIFLCPNPLMATTVVAVTTATEAYLGADSRAQGTDKPICKVIQSSTVAVGLSGHLADSATNFSAPQLVSRALSRSTDLESAIQNVLTDLDEPLKRSIEWGIANAPSEYQKQYEGKKVLELVFITAINGSPRLAVLYWRAEDRRLHRDGPTYQGSMQCIVVGNNSAVKAYQEDNPNWANASAKTLVRKFLEIEATSHPDSVGPPFSIIKLSKSGVEWADSGTCGDTDSKRHFIAPSE